MFLGFSACGGAPAPAPSTAQTAAPHDDLRRIVDRYWDEHVAPGNALSPQFLADSLSLERRFLTEVLAVPRAPLDQESRLTYDIFRRQRELNIEGLTYPSELMPLDPFDGMPQQLARAAADTEQYPFKTAKDYANWELRIDGYVQWSRQAIVNMRDGMRRGYTSPRVLMERMLPLLQGFGEDTSANVFYIPLRTMPDTIQESERTRLTASLSAAVRDKLLPAFRELHDFVEKEYLPRTRTSVALSALPLGPSWYASRVRRATGGQLTANDIHTIGLAEVERIRARMVTVPAPAQPTGTGPTTGTGTGTGTGAGAGVNAGAARGTSTVIGTTPAASSSGDALVSAYRELEAQTLDAMPLLFSAVPDADVEIRASGLLNPAAALLTYRRAAVDGGTPAILYVNTAAGTARRAKVEIPVFLREAIPGRHYQYALQSERADLPKFRRFGGEPAFTEGWAEYAASLGEELGMYRDDESRREDLSGQLKCAVALVVDTGLHAQGWTHAQAADYLRVQLAAEAADADLDADRFVALPGDALACKVGELKFQALRKRAQEALGARFDIREFHAEILKDGAMPLDILEAKMQLWMEAAR
jgi:uncharacterized protein (DUF885 family)